MSGKLSDAVLVGAEHRPSESVVVLVEGVLRFCPNRSFSGADDPDSCLA